MIHAGQYLGPVLRVNATGAGVDTDDGVGVIVFIEEQRLELEVIEVAGDVGKLAEGLDA